MPRLLAYVLFVLLSSTCCADDAEKYNELFTRGTRLVSPYLTLSDRPAESPETPRAQSDLAEGIAALQGAVDVEPQRGGAWWFLGMAYRVQGNADASRSAFAKAHEIDPNQPDFAREYAYSCMCSGQTKRAVEVAQAVSEKHPADAGLRANLALALLADHRLDEARSAAESALKLAPEDAVTQALLAEIEAVAHGKAMRRLCR